MSRSHHNKGKAASYYDYDYNSRRTKKLSSVGLHGGRDVKEYTSRHHRRCTRMDLYRELWRKEYVNEFDALVDWDVDTLGDLWGDMVEPSEDCLCCDDSYPIEGWDAFYGT